MLHVPLCDLDESTVTAGAGDKPSIFGRQRERSTAFAEVTATTGVGQVVSFGPVLLAYVDESGNTGDIATGGSLTYTLGCVLVDSTVWPQAFDELLSLRRRLRDRFGLKMRAELRANDLLRNGGAIRDAGLAPGQRFLIYRAVLSNLTTLPALGFAVVADKRCTWPSGTDYFALAWETLLQRLERTSTKTNQPFMVIHDEGENDRVRAWTRRARRHLTSGSAIGGSPLRNPARMLVDDPVPRNSKQSYFVQVADLLAYAAFRSVVPPGGDIAQVCPVDMWAQLGDATHRAVSGLKPRAEPGIVLRVP